MKKIVFALIAFVAISNVSADLKEVPVNQPAVVQEKVDWKTKLPKEDQINDFLQEISVTIKAGQSQGSGVIIVRKVQDQNVSFVWTAAHVVSSCRKTRQVIDPKTGTPKILVEFDDVQVCKDVLQDGTRVGRVEFDAKVIRYSDADNGQDLALLQVKKNNYNDVGAVFYLDEKFPTPGVSVLHVGSLRGQAGANSMTSGIVSQNGRILEGAGRFIYDQVSAAAMPGSSGGGVYTTNAACIGLVVRGVGESFSLIVPVRRIKGWADEAGIPWAVDENYPVPDIKTLEKMPVEDVGASWVYEAALKNAQK